MRGSEAREACGASSDARVPTHCSLIESRTTNHEPRATSHEPRTTNHGSTVAVDLGGRFGYGFLGRCGLCLLEQVGDERVAFVEQLLTRPAAARRSDGILAEQRQADRRVHTR